jgi:hypothetical protein
MMLEGKITVIATPEDDNDYVKALDADYQSEYCSSDA